MLLLLLVLPGAAAGQPASVEDQPASAEDPERCAWEARPADEVVAGVLYERSRRLASDHLWEQAAEAMEASAMLHPPCRAAVARLRQAARLFHYADDLERARLAMIAAAERAVDLGEPALAAHAYLDAAEFARLMGDRGATLLPIAAALELTRAKALTRSEREAIARRLRGEELERPGDTAPVAVLQGS